MNFLSPGSADVQVSLLDLSSSDRTGWLRRGYEVLSADEIDRAARLRAGTPRDEFVAGRAALRLLLGEKLGVSPGSLQFSVGLHGKPKLASDDAGVHFNVAHSGGVILLALSSKGPVGIDIERVDRRVEILDVARSAFHPEEITVLERLDCSAQAAEFFRFWTAKEAVMKADGRGLTLDLHSFSVASHASAELRIDIPADATWSRGAQSPDSGLKTGPEVAPFHYYVRRLPLGTQFASAVAVTTPAQSLRFQDLSISLREEVRPFFFPDHSYFFSAAK